MATRNLPLTLCCYPYDRTRPLFDGRVRVDGVDLTCLTEIGQPERQWRMTRWLEFDICEYSLSSYVAYRTQGAPIVAVPVFPYRKFRHGYMFTNRSKGIRHPRELEGRKVGLRNWQVTAAVWARGILASEYGVDLTAIDWYTHDQEDVSFPPPPGFRITRTDQGADMDQMLCEGELDALIYPKLPTSMIKGDPRVGHLFADYRSEEIAYYRRTGIFPIMHVLVFREELVQRHPWVPREVMKAFQTAKEHALYRLDDTRELTAAWIGEAIAEERRLFGRDPMPYGFSPNKATLETFLNYALEQGLIQRKPSWNELFYPPSLDESAQGYFSPMV